MLALPSDGDAWSSLVIRFQPTLTQLHTVLGKVSTVLRILGLTLGLPLACLPVTGSYCPTPCILSEALSAGR